MAEDFSELIHGEQTEIAAERRAEEVERQREEETRLERERRLRELEELATITYDEKDQVFAALHRAGIPNDTCVSYYSPYREPKLGRFLGDLLEVRITEHGWILDTYEDHDGADWTYRSWIESIALLTNGDVVAYEQELDTAKHHGRLLMDSERREKPFGQLQRVRECLAHAVAKHNLKIGGAEGSAS